MNNITLTYISKKWYDTTNLLNYYIYIEKVYYED